MATSQKAVNQYRQKNYYTFSVSVPARYREAIKAAAGKILEKVELFDVYKGSQIAAGKKSVAFNITMRASDRTLTDEEVGGAMNKILKALEELGAQIRS